MPRDFGAPRAEVHRSSTAWLAVASLPMLAGA
jgi:hypothetical protein